MTGMQVATLAVVFATLVALCLLVILGVPGVARLIFRHRLEVIRDECMDATLRNELRTLPSVQQFITTTEASAARPQSLSLPRVFAAYQAMVSLGIDVRKVAPPPRYTELAQHERAVMEELENRVCDAYSSYLTWGSPMSWLLRLVVSFLSAVHPGSDTVPAEDALPAVAREALQGPDWHLAHKSLVRHIYAGR
jgi:hypothetical protein